jgi:hypothetical protein
MDISMVRVNFYNCEKFLLQLIVHFGNENINPLLLVAFELHFIADWWLLHPRVNENYIFYIIWRLCLKMFLHLAECLLRSHFSCSDSLLLFLLSNRQSSLCRKDCNTFKRYLKYCSEFHKFKVQAWNKILEYFSAYSKRNPLANACRLCTFSLEYFQPFGAL